MKLIIKIIILAVLYGYSNGYAVAQDYKHELSIGMGGGLSTLNYSPSSGDSKNGMGGSISLNYIYALTKKIGLLSGFEYSLYNAKIENAAFSNTLTGITDPSDQEVFDFKTEINKYEEKQTAHYLNIPVMIQYKTGGTNQFYTNIGVKIGIPISARYKSTGNYTNQGFFYEPGIWTNTPQFMGFGEYPDKKVEEDLDLKIAFIASIELGIRFSLKNNKAFYTGAYFDYGLNDIIKNKQNVINYQIINNNKGEFYNHSMLSSYTNEDIELTNKVIPMSIGLKLRFSFYQF